MRIKKQQKSQGWLANLDKHFAKEGHDVGGIDGAESANDTDGQFTDLKHLVLQRNEQRRQVLRLRQVRVKLLIQRHEH